MKINPISKLIPILIILLLIGLGFGGYYLFQYQSIKEANQVPKNNSIQKDDLSQLIEEVGKLIELPTGEEPTLATVTDLEKLKEQPFFANAKIGHKVLIYQLAKKAFLYDPKAKKIIEVGPLNLGTKAGELSSSNDLATSSAKVEKIKIKLLNGTRKIGLTGKYEGSIKDSLPESTISGKEKAEKNDYEKSFVVLISSKFKTEAEKIAKELKAELSSLPAGEIKPKDGEADFLIILGKDKAN